MELPPGELSDRTLLLNTDIQLVDTSWKWSLREANWWQQNLSQAGGKVTSLLHKTATMVIEYPDISAFSSFIFQLFAQPRTIAEGIDLTITHFEWEDQRTEATELLLKQIKEAVNSQILVSQS